tara:strand:+ start:225 stop:812 length:588 start_codon:yes stop_codon:yes gene_type:complete
MYFDDIDLEDESLTEEKPISQQPTQDQSKQEHLEEIGGDQNIDECMEYKLIYNKSVEVVKNSYDLDKNNKIQNDEFIENIWLEELEPIDENNLTGEITNIYIDYPKLNEGYNFYYNTIPFIMDNFRFPRCKKKRTSYLISSLLYRADYENIDKKWDFNFYIYTKDYIYYSNGLRNDHGKYFNIIPRIPVSPYWLK